MINYTTIDYAPSNYCISFKYFSDPTDVMMSQFVKKIKSQYVIFKAFHQK